MELKEIIKNNKIIAVLEIDDANDAVPLAEALLQGGIGAMELTLRTPAAPAALKIIREKVPSMTAGTGTILNRGQVHEVKALGAHFGVSPGLNRGVLEEAAKEGLPFAPGIATPSDIEAALECGCRIMKFFPAEPLGGLTYLQSIAAPYRHLGVQFLPLGGINEGNLLNYLQSPLVCAVGGSWIAPRTLIQQKRWSEIRQRAESASAIIREIAKK